MEFEWRAMEDYLTKTDQYAVEVGGGSVFVVPEEGEASKREKYSSGHARLRFLERACQEGLSASEFMNFLENDDLSDSERGKAEELLKELLLKKDDWDVLAEGLNENE